MNTKDNISQNDTLSIVKGIGIILVVVTHSLPPYFFYNFLNLFQLCLFYVCSGYFFKEEYADNKVDFVWKRIKKLYFPFLKYSIIFLVLHNLFFKLNLYTDVYGFDGEVSKLYTLKDYLKNIILIVFRFNETEQLLGPLWFLESLFVANILFCLTFWISKILSKKHYILVLSGLVLFLYVSGFLIKYYHIKLPNGINREFILVSLLYLGFLYKRYFNNYATNKFLLLLCIVFLLIEGPYCRLVVVHTQFINPVIFLLITSAGFYMIVSLARYLNPIPAVNSILIYLGNHTMPIFVYHLLFFKIVSLLKIGFYGYDAAFLSKFPVISENNLIWWLLYACAGIIIPLYFDKFTRLVGNKIAIRNKK